MNVPLQLWTILVIIGAAAALALVCVCVVVWRCRARRAKKRLLGSPEALARLHKSAKSPLQTPADVLNTRLTPGLKFQTHTALKTTADSHSGDTKDGSPQVGTKPRTPSSTTVSFISTDSEYTDTSDSSFLSTDNNITDQQPPQLSTQSWPLAPPACKHQDGADTHDNQYESHRWHSVQRSAHSSPVQRAESSPAQQHAESSPAQRAESQQHVESYTNNYFNNFAHPNGPHNSWGGAPLDDGQSVQLPYDHTPGLTHPPWGTSTVDSAAFATARASMLIQEVFDAADPATMPHWAPRDISFQYPALNFTPFSTLRFNGSKTGRERTSSLHSSVQAYFGGSSKASSLLSSLRQGYSPRSGTDTSNNSSLFSSLRSRQGLSPGGSATTANSPREGAGGLHWLGEVSEAFFRASRSEPGSPREGSHSPRTRKASRFKHNPRGHGPYSPPGSSMSTHGVEADLGAASPRRRKQGSVVMQQHDARDAETMLPDGELGPHTYHRSITSRYARFKALQHDAPSGESGDFGALTQGVDHTAQLPSQHVDIMSSRVGRPPALQRPPPLAIDDDVLGASQRGSVSSNHFPPWLRVHLQSFVNSPRSPAGSVHYNEGMYAADPIPHLMHNFGSTTSTASTFRAADNTDIVTRMLHEQYQANMRTSSSTETEARGYDLEQQHPSAYGAGQELSDIPPILPPATHSNMQATTTPPSTSTIPDLCEMQTTTQPPPSTDRARRNQPLARTSPPPNLDHPTLSARLQLNTLVQPSRTNHLESTNLRKHLAQLSAASLDMPLSEPLQQRGHSRTLSNAFSDLSSVDTARAPHYSHSEDSFIVSQAQYANPVFDGPHIFGGNNGASGTNLDFENPFFDTDRHTSSDGGT